MAPADGASAESTDGQPQDSSDAPAPARAAVSEGTTAPGGPAAPQGDAVSADPVAATSETDNKAERIEALQARIEGLEQRAEEAEMAALLADDTSVEVEDPTLRIYGFADFGFQRTWTDPETPVANFIEANAASFVIGNLNLYFDAKPADQWRTLIEVRFTNAPHGLVNSPGGIAGTFDREDTYQIDPHGSGLNVPMWRGSIVLERAWTEWQAHQLIKIRVGNFFTPWGIWNIDHGSPTLITLTLPQSILQYAFPIRQTGLQLYGSTFAGDWQLGYHLTLTNGRNEISNFDFNDGKALGARLFARRELGTVNFTLGVSGYTGSQQDEQVDVTGANPLTFEQYANWRFREDLVGVDIAFDYDDFRIRTELTARSRRYDANKLAPANPLFTPVGYTTPSSTDYWAYVIVAQRLPWLGLEPYMYADGQHSVTPVGDKILTFTPGLNVHFTPGTLLKLAYSYSFFLKVSNEDLLANIEDLDVHSVLARVVTAF